MIPGTALAAYGHGDWNDSLQPADPMMRERMCSAWTVTLHFQMLNQLAEGLRAIGRNSEAATLEDEANTVLKDFQRLLLVNDVLAGYALFEHDGRVRYLLHPTDDATGVQYSSLAMIHAILEDLLTPEQARAHLQLIEKHLSGPDGVRLFDRPLPYRGGPQKFFQRAESATYASAVRSGSCTRTRTFATRRRSRMSAMRRRSSARCVRPIRSPFAR